MKPIGAALLYFALLAAMAVDSRAQELYIANQPQQKLLRLDLTTGVQTTLYDTVESPTTWY